MPRWTEADWRARRKTSTVAGTVEAKSAQNDRLPRILLWVLLCLFTYRLAYHSLYLRDSAFALATFSDGRLYEDAARDILAKPPLGTKPFYLQGLYAYFIALGMSVQPTVASALLLQLVLSALACYLFFLAARNAFGATAGGLSAAVLLAYPALTFYENKYLSAELGIASNIAVLLAFGLYARAPGGAGALGLGAASALSLLARPNMALAVPATIWAAVLIRGGSRRGLSRDAVAFVLGAFLVLSPMALRNQLVTGKLEIFPSHGGGTSFYIGNNPFATGLWNSAGGLFSGQVGVERLELPERLGTRGSSRAEKASSIGAALYDRSFSYIADNPGHWLALEVRKLWYVGGNEEITQDYDLYGEREIIPLLFRVGLPFGFLLALGAFGFWATLASASGQPSGPRARAKAWAVLAGGQWLAALAANLLFFTSSQHRLPLAVPLALFAGPALLALREMARDFRGYPLRGRVVLALCLLLFAQSFWPRTRRKAPSTAHYYNLAVVQQEAGDVATAIETLGIAIARRPGQPEFVLDRARMARELGRFEQAQADLKKVVDMPGLPRWLLRLAAREQALLMEARRAARSP